METECRHHYHLLAHIYIQPNEIAILAQQSFVFAGHNISVVGVKVAVVVVVVVVVAAAAAAVIVGHQ